WSDFRTLSRIMRISSPNSPTGRTEVVVLTADKNFEAQARQTFGASDQITLRVASGALSALGDNFEVAGATVAVVDLDASRPEEREAADRLMARVGSWPQVVVITPAFDETVARTLLQMRVADFLIKPVSPVELVRTCARVARGSGPEETTEAQILTFLPAV